MTVITSGLLEIEAEAPLAFVDNQFVADFNGAAPSLVVNGTTLSAATVAGLVEVISEDVARRRRQVLAIPYAVHAEGDQLIIEPHVAVSERAEGCHLSGADAVRALEKAHQLITDQQHSWPLAPADVDQSALPPSVGDRGFPMIVSMPRTGSTLLGTMLLLLRDPPDTGPHVFRRYIHEPVSPVYWQGRGLDAITEIAGASLSDDDIVQESAYQFASGTIARHFLTRARRPVIFLVRHPQLAWPSRWRVMLKMLRAEEAHRADWPRIDHALDSWDFRDVGDLLVASVRPADNGWYALLTMIEMCRTEGIDHVIVTNGRFRDHPEALMHDLCKCLDVEHDPAVTTWQNLDEALPRVVMGEMARNDEYEWYYARTLGSRQGILRSDVAFSDPDRFPDEFRGSSVDCLTIDEAVTWHHALLTRDEVLD
jgi:hypothetical protein